MALLHRATLTPGKMELIGTWLPRSEWWIAAEGAGPLAEDPERIAAFRFDDPDGEVGVETLIVRAGAGTVVQIPLTYRARPLEGADTALVGTTEHSVLGTRWVYDAEADPVYRAELARVIAEGDREVEQYYETDGVREPRPADAHVRGSGSGGVTASATLVVVRFPLADPPAAGDLVLRGTWPGQDEPVVLAHLA